MTTTEKPVRFLRTINRLYGHAAGREERHRRIEADWTRVDT